VNKFKCQRTHQIHFQLESDFNLCR